MRPSKLARILVKDSSAEQIIEERKGVAASTISCEGRVVQRRASLLTRQAHPRGKDEGGKHRRVARENTFRNEVRILELIATRFARNSLHGTNASHLLRSA